MPRPRPWIFYDFKNARGDNEIMEWTSADGEPAKARMNALIGNLSVLERAFTRDDKVGLLRKAGDCDGEDLIELVIKVNNVQYRPIGWYGPDARTVTLLIGAIEKGKDFEPRNACMQAVNRKRLILTNGRRHIVEHDYS